MGYRTFLGWQRLATRRHRARVVAQANERLAREHAERKRRQ